MALPSKVTADEEDIGAECSICYAFYLPGPSGGADSSGGSIPEESCSAPRCGRLFHKQCLVEWLQSDASSTRAFNTLFGQCPFCTNTISIKLD